jgi:hypothetical protein
MSPISSSEGAYWDNLCLISCSHHLKWVRNALVYFLISCIYLLQWKILILILS